MPQRYSRFVRLAVLAALCGGVAACATIPSQQPTAVIDTAMEANRLLDTAIDAVAARGVKFAALKYPAIRQGFRQYIIDLNPLMSQGNEDFLAQQFFAYIAFAPHEFQKILLGKTTAEILVSYGAPTKVLTSDGWENPIYLYLDDDKTRVSRFAQIWR